MHPHSYLDEHSLELVKRRVRLNTHSTDEASRDISYRLPELGKADAAIEVNEVGTFTLHTGKPDALGDATDTREAFALCAFEAGDIAEIKRYRGEASQGFLGATKCGGGSLSVRIAKANADIDALAIGEFTYQTGLPSGLADDTETVDAYPLCKVKANDLAVILTASDGQGGTFKLAMPCSDGSAACICALDAMLQKQDARITALEP